MQGIAAWGRALARFAGVSLMIAGGITAFFLIRAGWRGWSPVLTSAAANLVLSIAIGGFCWASLPVIAHRTCRWPAVFRWGAMLATMTGAAVAGTGVGVWVARVLGVSGSAADLYLGTIRTSLPITIVVGVVITVIETSKARLADSELALRTQQVERERAEKVAAEARLASLSSRVQPHFLFNTLNSIAALIREDPRRAEQMTERLGSLLRGSLDAAPTVPIAHEMKLVDDYLEIQSARLGERLRYRLDWHAESMNGAMVPPFAIQSLVENAVKHVAGQRREGVEVHLTARADAGVLVFEVSDNGPGFGSDAIVAGHGLDTLQERLRALYGGRAALELRRTAAGMTVRLTVPSP